MFDNFFDMLKDYLTTSIWCGYCGSNHRFNSTDIYINCPITGQNLQSEYAWRVYDTSGHINYIWETRPEIKSELFIAWDNLAKWRGEYEHKLEIEQEIWGIMYKTHKDKCSDCKKNEIHKDMWLKASWRRI